MVEEKVEVTGMVWLRGFLGTGGRGHHGLVVGPHRRAGPPPPGARRHPLLLPPESSNWTLRFVMHHVHHKIFEEGRWVWVDERGGPRGQTPAGGEGGFRGDGNGSRKCRGGKKGKVVPPSDNGVMMFEMVLFNVFTPDVKKGGGGRAQHFRFLCHCWEVIGLGCSA